MSGAERRAVAVLASVFSVRMLGLFLLLPVVALYADDLVGATPVLIGLAVGAYGITQALLQIPFGLMSDRLGRKPVIVGGLLLFALGSLIAAASETAIGLVAGRALQGAGAVSAAITALVADLTSVSVRTRAMAIIGATIGASFVLALVIGPLLAALLGIAGLFQVTAGLAVLAALVVALAVPTPELTVEPMTTPRALSEALGNPQLLRLDLGVLVLHLVLTASFVAVPLALAAQGSELASHSRIYLLAILISVVPTVTLIIGTERLGRPAWLISAAILLVSAGQLLLWGLGESRWGMLAALAVFFSGFNFLEARLPARMTELAGDSVRGAALGVYATSQFMGAFAGGVLGGWLLGATGPTGVYLACALASLIWWLINMLSAQKAQSGRAPEGGRPG